MDATRYRRAIAASAATLSGLGVLALVNTVGAANPVVTFTPAAATDDVQTAPNASADAATDDRGGCDRDGEHTPLDAATAAKVQAAAEKAVSDATFEHAGHDRTNPDGYVAMMKKADGTHVLVHENADFTVTKIEDPAPARGPGGPGGRHHRGDGERDHGGTTPTTAASA
jgi:hypothetical protein